LFATATSGIVADLEMRGEGTLGGIRAWIDTIRPAGTGALAEPVFAVLAPSVCLEFVT
jgi:hypothetical protein